MRKKPVTVIVLGAAFMLSSAVASTIAAGTTAPPDIFASFGGFDAARHGHRNHQPIARFLV